ncbi:MAG: hypothetical protein ACW972_04235 [Promethearchaeota archaeon]|jgi:hypothetical protein
MAPKTRNYNIISRRTFLIILLIFSFIIPIIYLGNFIPNTTFNEIPLGNDLGINQFSKDDYNPILSFEEYGLGNITIDDLHFDFYDLGTVNDSEDHPLVDNDVFGTFSLLYFPPESGVEFIEAINSATYDNLNGTRTNSIALILNETLSVYYNNTQAGYLIYHTAFFNAKLLDFYVDDGSSIIKLTQGIDFSINGKEYIVFYYEDYFKQGSIFNFKMHLIWEYSVSIGDWSLAQNDDTPLVMTKNEQEITTKFTYQFYLLGFYFLPDLQSFLPIDYIAAAITIYPPERELLSYQDFIINTIFVDVNDYVNTDKSISIEISDLFKLNRSFISLNFTCTFGLKFEESVGNSWAIDRLLSERNLRERIYFLSITTGPRYIYLKNVSFYDPGIIFDPSISASSLFGRAMEFSDLNDTIPGQLGLKIIMPYLILGETCPFSIQYRATQTLNIIVTDNIKMPLVGVKVEILHFGATYGTYISNKTVQPIDPGRTNENGQVLLDDIPRGNYTARVIWQGKIVKDAIVSTDLGVNYVLTNVPHFPLWILIFGMISGIILVVGTLFYLKFKKLR